MRKKFIVVFITAASYSEARRIADTLVAKRLIACANISKGIDSIFRWKANVDTAREVLLICKTKMSCFGRLKKQVKQIHSYEVPEIISLPIIAGNKDYLKWIEESVK